MKMTLKKYLAYAVVLVLLLSSSFTLGQAYADNNKDPINDNNIDSLHTQANTSENKARLGTKAQIIYMKYFALSGAYSVSYDKVRSELVGSTESEIKEEFTDWQVVYLDEQKVILQQTIDSYGPQTYIISTIEKDKDEFVCVYSYDDEGTEILYSVFDTPVALFDEDTIKKLRDGIMVTGKDNLLTALEAFGE